MAIISVYFSPTGGTEWVVRRLAMAMGVEERWVDLSAPQPQKLTFEPGDCCVIGVPSYGGRVPAIAMERLAQCQGDGISAVLVACYGNRAFEDTVVELYDGAVAAGFLPIGAVAAVCEHSIMPQFASHRPNDDDLAQLDAFGAGLRQRLEQGSETPLILPGNRPYRHFGGVPLKPKATSACNQCGQCAQACPVGAIPMDKPSQTEGTRCITCMRCVRNCPQQARKLPGLMTFLAGQKMKKTCTTPKENQLF